MEKMPKSEKINLILIFGLSVLLLASLLLFPSITFQFPWNQTIIFSIAIHVPLISTILFLIIAEIKRRRKIIPEGEGILLKISIKTRKFLYFIPIAIFFAAWWVNIGIAIDYLVEREVPLDIWLFKWPKLTNHFLMYTNTFSSFCFGCYSWSVITYYLGTRAPKLFTQEIRLITLSYPFWFGISVHLGLIGPKSYLNGWLALHIIFGVWEAKGSLLAIVISLTSLVKKYSLLEWLIKSKKFDY